MVKKLIHTITGSGSGKSTCSNGLALRYVSYHNKIKNKESGDVYRNTVFIGRFLKDFTKPDYFLMKSTKGLINIKCQKIKHLVFSDGMTPEIIDSINNFWEICKQTIDTGYYDMVILDELLVVLDLKVLRNTEVFNYLKHTNKDIEYVLTGRMCRDEVILKVKQISPYFNKIKCYRHPNQDVCVHCGTLVSDKIDARIGIEF